MNVDSLLSMGKSFILLWIFEFIVAEKNYEMSELDLYGDLIEPGEGDGTVVLPVEANVIVKQEDDPQDSLYNGIFCSLDSPVKRPQVTLQYFHRLVCIQCRNCTQFFACSFSVTLFLSYLLTINSKWQQVTYTI